MNISRMLKSRSARGGLAKVQRMAKLIQPLLVEQDSIQKNREKIRSLLDEQLENDEYIVLVNEEGLGLVHTNRLREGNLFSDEVGLIAFPEGARECHYRKECCFEF
jgi:methyl-accepting chemotaxis protein